MEKIRVGMVGYGLAGSVFHAPLIRATPGLELTDVVTSRDVPGGLRALPSPGELWRSGVELAVIASPNRTHVPLARAALEAGLHVVVDKPLAATADEARGLVELAEARGLMLSVFQNRRWDGDFLTAAEAVRAGRLGRVHRFESRFERFRPELKGGWRELGDPAEAGGLLYDLGSHLVDQALTLFGPARSVYAELAALRPGAQADDDAFVALTHTDGTRSHLWMSAVAADPGPRLRVLGSTAAYVTNGLDSQEDALRAGRVPGDEGFGANPPGVLGGAPHPTKDGAYADYYAGVVRTLREGAPPPVDARDAVATLTVLEAARRSAARSTVEEL